MELEGGTLFHCFGSSHSSFFSAGLGLAGLAAGLAAAALSPVLGAGAAAAGLDSFSASFWQAPRARLASKTAPRADRRALEECCIGPPIENLGRMDKPLSGPRDQKERPRRAAC